MKTKISKPNLKKKQSNSSQTEFTVLEHLLELRSRLLSYFVCLAVASGIAYYFHPSVIQFLIQPLNQQLYYTNPAGGLQFGIQIAIFVGFITTVPLLVYHTLRYIEPVLTQSSLKLLDGIVFSSMLLVFIGVCVAYFLIVPAALRFLQDYGAGSGMQALITVDQYFSFLTLYLGGFAILFQLPLVLYLITKFTSATWKTFLGFQRYVIVGALIGAAILTPTPDLFNLALFAMPIILLFYISLGVMALTGKRK